MTDYCPKCKNETVACTCMDDLIVELGKTVIQYCKTRWAGNLLCINIAVELDKIEDEKNES